MLFLKSTSFFAYKIWLGIIVKYSLFKTVNIDFLKEKCVINIFFQFRLESWLWYCIFMSVTFVLLVERFPRDCQDILWEGYSESKVYKIYPQGSGELDVFCDQHTDGGGWTVCDNCYLLMRPTYQFQISMFSCATCNISKICVSLLFL